MIERNIFLPNVRDPFILNSLPTNNLQDLGTTTGKTYTYFYVKDHTLQNFP